MEGTDLSILTDPSYIPFRRRDTSCGHAIHPAVTDYSNPQCPYCRIVHAMRHVRRSQAVIKRRGGVHEWFERCKEDDDLALWSMTTGVGQKSRVTAMIDINGNNYSYRSAKVRLHNVLIELEILSVQEKAWKIELAGRTGLQSTSNKEEQKMERMRNSATMGLFLYRCTVEEGFVNELEKNSMKFMRKRGRDWEVSTDPDYPSSDSEATEVTPPKRFRTNAQQRRFITASSIPEVGADIKDIPQEHKRRRVHNNVTFDEEVYVRSEADVDKIWSASSSRRSDTPNAVSSPSSVSCTGVPHAKPIGVNSSPCQAYQTRPLKRLDESRRRSSCWSRRPRARESGLYPKGLWTVSDDCVNVNTSGYRFAKDHEGWETYVDNSVEEGKNWKMDAELNDYMREHEVAHKISDEHDDGEEENEGYM
jgi:hypothetical protein